MMRCENADHWRHDSSFATAGGLWSNRLHKYKGPARGWEGRICHWRCQLKAGWRQLHMKCVKKVMAVLECMR